MLYTFLFLIQLTIVFCFSKNKINTNPVNYKMEPILDIKHLVVSGGSYGGLIYYGIVKELIKNNVIDFCRIETFYGTSVGTYLIVFLLLGYDWDTLDDYIIKRPWHTIFKIDMEFIIRGIQSGGLLNDKVLNAIFEPLFKGKDISINITMQEFYDLTHKEVHFFTTDLENIETVDICYKTHPEWKLLDAVYASASLPIIFEPFYDMQSDKVFLDGAVLLNYPLNRCLKDTEEYDKILGIYHNDSVNHFANKNPMKEKSFYRLLEYIFLIIVKLWLHIKYKRSEYEKNVPHQIPVDFPMGLDELVNTWNTQQERERLVRLGESYAHAYINRLNRTDDISDPCKEIQ